MILIFHLYQVVVQLLMSSNAYRVCLSYFCVISSLEVCATRDRQDNMQKFHNFRAIIYQ